MKIAVNTRLLIKDKLEGIGWFTFENLKRITTQHPEHEFFFIFDRHFSDDFVFSNNIHPLVISPQARHPFLYYLWFEYSIPHVLKKIKPDLFFSPDGYLSLSADVKSMNVFHDLNFEHYPEDLPFFERKYYRHFFPRYAHKAAHIATVSEYSKSDVVKQYGIAPEKISVVYNGANEKFKPVNALTQKEIRAELTGGSPYFVFVGALHPRKNLVNLFKAFDLFKPSDDQNLKLVVVGEKKWWTEDIRRTYEGLKFREDVIFSGRLGIDKLTKVVGSALALTYVSYFEGFGIPIVEAYNAGVPVITSDITSMPEVAGDAALLIDPFSPQSIADAMHKIAKDEKLRDDLIMKGRNQKKEFTWQKSSERLWKAIESCLQ
ncbi:MAG: glycosyltransferase family 4 protein [Bacteroidales bacterium]|nr:glycosyltransferase family 4 protein [Bacteroidales bacterium]MCF8403750.1 glycosyltransferase family 4 protein [Bacteroidales bacterium]